MYNLKCVIMACVMLHHFCIHTNDPCYPRWKLSVEELELNALIRWIQQRSLPFLSRADGFSQPFVSLDPKNALSLSFSKLLCSLCLFACDSTSWFKLPATCNKTWVWERTTFLFLMRFHHKFFPWWWFTHWFVRLCCVGFLVSVFLFVIKNVAVTTSNLIMILFLYI